MAFRILFFHFFFHKKVKYLIVIHTNIPYFKTMYLKQLILLKHICHNELPIDVINIIKLLFCKLNGMCFDITDHEMLGLIIDYSYISNHLSHVIFNGVKYFKDENNDGIIRPQSSDIIEYIFTYHGSHVDLYFNVDADDSVKYIIKQFKKYDPNNIFLIGRDTIDLAYVQEYPYLLDDNSNDCEIILDKRNSVSLSGTITMQQFICSCQLLKHYKWDDSEEIYCGAHDYISNTPGVITIMFSHYTA